MMRSIDSKLFVLVLVAAGCGATPVSSAPLTTDTAPPAEAPAPTAEVAPPSEVTTESAAPASKPVDLTTGRKEEEGGSLRQRLMKVHFNQTAAIRDAVIAGNLHKAVQPAAALAEMEGVETLPKRWQYSVEQLQLASRRIREGSDIQEVAAATADIGRACASCHASVSGPKIVVGSPPGGADSMGDRMKRHMWATERLWEGIYGPSDNAWEEGAAALELDPFPKDKLSKGGVHALSSAARFAKFSANAAERKTGEQRAELYASLLATCSPCHAAMGVGD